MNKGFTIIELIVVISIISILSILMLVNYGAGRKTIKEQQSIQILAQAFRSVQNKALGGEVISCTDPPCKYGVYIEDNSSTILIFADGVVSNSNAYELGEEIESIKLEEGVVITQISVPPAAGGIPNIGIFFAPPDPAISFNPPLGPSASIVIFEITGGRRIHLGKLGGSVDIQ